ncbi:hypothetical protein [Moheibacter sediminis]|uniref:Lipoprotein n=1 Tax=Moheibacter sediminis TaxID=1434700 RepID=A0A1W1Z3J5_9FLAO|nr:hypothetical protein [Moheibacter sediminis]SMC42528.1 hypothetical protein SAMN06296427_102127 [Moheibacter sediminis]
MKRTILLMGIIASFFVLTSCLDNEEFDFVPKAAETDNIYYERGGDKNDSIPSDSTGTVRPPTGGEQGQNPIKP